MRKRSSDTPPSEALYRSLLDLIVPQGPVEETRNVISTGLVTGHTAFESVRRKKDGTLVYLDISMKSIPEADGWPAFVLIGQRGITRRRQAEGQRCAAKRTREVGHLPAHHHGTRADVSRHQGNRI